MSKIRLTFTILLNVLVLFLTHQFFSIFSVVFKVIKITDNASKIATITEKLFVDSDTASKVLDLTGSSLNISVLVITAFVLLPALLVTVLLFSRISIKKNSDVTEKDLKFSNWIIYISIAVSFIYSVVSYALSMLFYTIIYHVCYYLIWNNVFIKRLRDVGNV